MYRHFPGKHTHLPISLDVHNQLQSASCNTGYEREDWEIANEAIDEWMRRHDPNALAGPAYAGYQWKRLFLPDGTVLRTVFGGKNYHCLVDGDRIVYDKRAVSPSGFVNAVGGIRRNAWKSTWILFPESKDWKLADSLRTRDRPRREHKAASPPPQERQLVDVRASAGDPPSPRDSVNAAPGSVRPAGGALPARRGRFKLAAFKARHTRHVAQPRIPEAELRQPHQGPQKAPSPPGMMCAHERRANFPPRSAERRRGASG